MSTQFTRLLLFVLILLLVLPAVAVTAEEPVSDAGSASLAAYVLVAQQGTSGNGGVDLVPVSVDTEPGGFTRLEIVLVGVFVIYMALTTFDRNRLLKRVTNEADRAYETLPEWMGDTFKQAMLKFLEAGEAAARTTPGTLDDEAIASLKKDFVEAVIDKLKRDGVIPYPEVAAKG